MLNFKPALSLPSFTFLKQFFLDAIGCFFLVNVHISFLINSPTCGDENVLELDSGDVT